MSISNVVGNKEGLEVTRDIEEMEVKSDMLRSYGFDVWVESYICGFWLIHWRFPQLRLV